MVARLTVSKIRRRSDGQVTNEIDLDYIPQKMPFNTIYPLELESVPNDLSNGGLRSPSASGLRQLSFFSCTVSVTDF